MTAPGPGYVVDKGTSFASPMVAALALWLWTLDPELAYDQVRGLLTDPRRTTGIGLGSGGGSITAARQVDAFAATLGIDELRGDKAIRTALADLDDGTPDGNRRVVYDDHGLATSQDRVLSTPDEERGDGRISMADVRALRDAMIAVNIEAILAGGGDPVHGGSPTLDGGFDHPKLDLNGDGCVGVHPVRPEAVGCAGAPTEDIGSRFDLNGDNLVNAVTVAPVLGVQRTDLGMLGDVWPSDATLTEGWSASQLERLLPAPPYDQLGSGDVSFRFAAATKTVDEIRITMLQAGTPVTRTLVPDRELVWTLPINVAVPVKAIAFAGGVAAADALCVMRGAQAVDAVPALQLGEDIVLRVGACPTGPTIELGGGVSGWTRWGIGADEDSIVTNDLFVGDACYRDFDPRACLETKTRCDALAVGDTCVLGTGALTHELSSGVANARLERLGEREWSFSASLAATAVAPAWPTPPGGCSGPTRMAWCIADTVAAWHLRSDFTLDIPIRSKRYALTVTCDARGDLTPGSITLPTSMWAGANDTLFCQPDASPAAMAWTEHDTADEGGTHGPRTVHLDMTVYMSAQVEAGKAIGADLPGVVPGSDSRGLEVTTFRILAEELP